MIINGPPDKEKLVELPAKEAIDLYEFLGSSFVMNRFHDLSPRTRDKLFNWRKILKQEICK